MIMKINNELLRRSLALSFGSGVSADRLLSEGKGTTAQNDEMTGGGALTILDENLLRRAGYRLAATEMSKQQNIEDVVERADKLLQNDNNSNTEMSQDSIADQGWVQACLDAAGKIYNNDLKQLWAKILAGEIKAPGSYSLRVLDFMSKLSQKDAVRIRNLCQYVLYTIGKTDAMILRMRDSKTLTYQDFSYLMELRLINSSSLVVKKYRFGNGQGNIVLYHGDVVYIIEVDRPDYDLPIYSFTELGKEVLSIVDDTELDYEYLRAFSENVMTTNKGLKFMCGKMEIKDSVGNVTDEGILFKLPE